MEMFHFNEWKFLPLYLGLVYFLVHQIWIPVSKPSVQFQQCNSNYCTTLKLQKNWFLCNSKYNRQKNDVIRILFYTWKHFRLSVQCSWYNKFIMSWTSMFNKATFWGILLPSSDLIIIRAFYFALSD